MAKISAFQALMPTVETVGEVAAVPYDVVNREEAAALAAGKPLSFLHVSRSEIDLPPSTNPYSDEVYAKAVENFDVLKEEAPLAFDGNDNLYVYAQVMNGVRQTGLVGAVAVDDYDDNTVKKHEKTRQAKEDDRTRHTVELRAHSGPVFLLYKAQEEIDALINPILDTKPLFDVTAEDGVQHIVWTCPADVTPKLIELFGGLESLYVADGHHRAKSASRAREAMKAQNPDHTGDEEYNRFLAVMFPDNQLKILPYNRTVQDLNGLSKDEFLTKVGESFEITADAGPTPEAVGQVRMYLDKNWYGLVAKNVPATGKVADTLDVAVLQDQLLAPILGIDDPRTSERVDFIGGIRGTDELIRLVDSGKFEVAFSMYSTTVDQLIAISDAGEIMPPKSTWFEPKLRDGLLIHCF